MKSVHELLDLSGTTSIVTGGAQGIGLGIASRLAAAGSNVVIANLHGDIAAKAATDLVSKGWRASSIQADVSEEADVKKIVKFAVDTYGSINILVNNAGIFPSVAVSAMSKADFEKVIKTNLESVFLCTKYVSEQMIKQKKGGKIINVTSIDALHPSMVGLAHYDASKHGVWGFTKNTALELAPHKIWVNAIAPGGILTPGVTAMQSAPAGFDMKKILDAFLSHIPMHRMGEPDDIGKVALFLASDMSSYMTGSQIVVDGGVLLA